MSLLSKLCAVAGLAVCVEAVAVAVDWSSDPSLAKSSRGTGGPPLRIDERAGSIGRHALGDRLSAVSATLGPAGRNDASNETYLPLGADADGIGAPAGFGFPAPCDKPLRGAPQDGTPGELGVVERSFRGVGVGACREKTFMFVVSSRGSRTARGAAIGQPLAAARARYPMLRCATAPGSTTPPVPVYRFCTGRIAPHRYLWLGQDPVSSIAIATVRMGG